MKHRKLFALLGLFCCMISMSLVVAACGDDDDDSGSTSASTTADTNTVAAGDAIQKNDANASTTITVGSKNFTEQKVLGEIYGQALQAAGYKVKKELNLGDEKTAHK